MQVLKPKIGAFPGHRVFLHSDFQMKTVYLQVSNMSGVCMTSKCCLGHILPPNVHVASKITDAEFSLQTASPAHTNIPVLAYIDG